ncbi:hypothetical protein LTR22_026374 [Elasticomyces elasticus]|nr:hypothetical protein LTR22_026374 [Elasticomyces elasticus]
MSSYVNINAFFAFLEATGIPALEHWNVALWTVRPALEFPGIARDEVVGDALDFSAHAAAAWVEFVGPEMYQWTDEYAHGPLLGAPGEGGPLWMGKHGYCKERWKLWRMRLGDIAGSLNVDDGIRGVARQAEERMKAIEAEAEARNLGGS